MPLTEKQQSNQNHIQAARDADQSLKAYAEAHNLNVQSLYRERRRMRRLRQGPTSSLLRVQDVSGMPFAPMALLQVRLPNGVSLGIPTDQMNLADLIGTLARL